MKAMKAESIYDVLMALNDKEKKRLFQMLKKPLPKIVDSPYLSGWKGLSEHLGGTAKQTLISWEKSGLIQKYKIGKKVYFKRKEIAQAMIPVDK